MAADSTSYLPQGSDNDCGCEAVEITVSSPDCDDSIAEEGCDLLCSGLTGCMLATETSISLSAVELTTGAELATGAPEFGTPDLTENRIVLRPFPKNAGERNCYRYLLGQMQATPDFPHPTKDELEQTCRERFGVTVDSFNYCWREALEVTGARWDQPGRPPHQIVSC